MIKVDKDNNEVKLEGVEFKVYDEDGNYIETLITDKNGEAVSSKLRIDKPYTVQETKTLEKYASSYYPLSKADVDIKAGDIEKSLIYQSNTYWLSTRCVTANFYGNSVDFCLRCVGNGYMDACGLFTSTPKESRYTQRIRPVVVLSDLIEISYDSEANQLTLKYMN